MTQGTGSSPATRFCVRAVRPNDLAPSIIAAWAELEARAVEPNAYLSPYFVLPAVRYLDPKAQVMVFLIERIGAGSSDLVGLGVFRHVVASRHLPLPHLTTYQSRHSFLSGLLLDRDVAQQAIGALFDHFRTRSWSWHGIEFSDAWADGPLADLLTQVAGERKFTRSDRWPAERAVLVPTSSNVNDIDTALGSRAKDLKRCMRRLQEQGEVRWTAHRLNGVPASSVEAFLDLEDRGWKGQAGTSLRTRPGDEAFFREMIAGFSGEGRALMTELSVDGVVISSTSNLISGRAGFAFKIGWDPAFMKMSAGVLNEVELMRYAATLCTDIDFFDSGAPPGSYINDLWAARRPHMPYGAWFDTRGAHGPESNLVCTRIQGYDIEGLSRGRCVRKRDRSSSRRRDASFTPRPVSFP